MPNVAGQSWSQCGEDMVIRHRILGSHGRSSRAIAFTGATRLKPGFYVDIGAFSPKRYSNTYWLYRHGWCGITVEPRAESAWMFRQARPRDTHITAVIGRTDGFKAFSSADYSPLNSVIESQNETQCVVPSIRLATLLETHLPSARVIDLMSIDCEGSDIEVLCSNDWGRFRPRLICIEDFAWSPESRQSEISAFLYSHDYRPCAWAPPSVLWETLS
jgi:FkbM family methyltransferase